MGGYDAIVIGAGHNGLAAACTLAGRGRKVLVLERREVVGGLCAGEEFHPGYRHAGLLHDTTGVRPAVADTLRLHEHGLTLSDGPLEVYSPEESGDGLLLSFDASVTSAEIARFSSADAEHYRQLHAFIEKIGRTVRAMLNDVPPDLLNLDAGGTLGLLRQGVSVRRLGERDMMELLRIPPMCVADWLNEYFETELLKASLAAPALAGTWAGPWSPGTAANLLMWMCSAERPVRGGGAAVVGALERAARSAGVEIRTGTEVAAINVSGGKAQGVTLADGETLSAAVVASSCDPKTTFLGLIRPQHISHVFEHGVRKFRTRATAAQVFLALKRPPRFAGRPDASFEYVRTGEELDQLERAFDAVKYRRMSERLVLDVYVPTAARPDLAPAGHAVVSVTASFVPCDLAGGWEDAQREALGDAVVAELERYAPGVRESVVGRKVLTPADIAETYGVTDGHIFHGEHAIDQLVTRPTPECARYASPIAGLFLCGSGAHPGGGVTGAPGFLAAKVILATT